MTMWLRKSEKDRRLGRNTPIPTQVVSNEEYHPLPQTKDQIKVEKRINQLADKYGKKLGKSRREFFQTTGGMAVSFMAMNEVFGNFFQVDPAEAAEEDAYKELWPKDQFIFDCHTHHVRPEGTVEPLFFRKLASRFNKELEGVDPQEGDLKFRNYVKEVFLDSETSVACITGLPARTMEVIDTDEMVEARNTLNEMAGSQRMVSHGLVRPFEVDFLEQTIRQATELKVDAWKCYTGVPELGGEMAWTMDDEELIYPFYETVRRHGINKTVCVHKGLPLPGADIASAHPRDMKKAALDNPDINFVVYHSGFKAANYELPPGDGFIGEDGYLAWTTDLVRDREATPEMTNVYLDLGTTFGHIVITHPKIAGHFFGQTIRAFGADHIFFGTDSVWWGTPQWQIEALRRFQISEELQEEFGYAPITDEEKTMILGPNAAPFYGIDANEARKAIPDDALSLLKAEYRHDGVSPSNTQYGWIADNTRNT
jgi:predicted TIM-barrel fold metal-dependent hydrolase